MYTKNKEKIINLRVSEDDYNEINQIAQHFGKTTSNYLRQIIQQNIVTNKLAQTIVNNTNEKELKDIVRCLGEPYEN